MTPAQRRVAVLWWQPGALMAPAWWPQLALDVWSVNYASQPRLRPAIDRLLVARLGHQGPPPALDALSTPWFDEQAHAERRCLALGLWALQCPDYLLLGRFRLALAPTLSAHQLAQLACVFPPAARQAPETDPAALPALALAHGCAWLAQARRPALRLCRLLWPPSGLTPPAGAPDAVLEKLGKWI